MKKSSKTSSTPAPAKKSAKPAPKAVAAPAVKKTVSKAVITTVSAQIDIGFGNTLYLRGEGPGLSWSQGLPMACVADDQWSLAVGESARPVVFKLLINDEKWSTGNDYVVKPGAKITVTPAF